MERSRSDRFRGVRRPDRLDDDEREQQDIAEMEWRRRVLRQKAGTHCPERRACYRRESVGQRSSLPVDVEHGSPERCGRKAGREALDQPGKHQPLDTPSRKKEHEGDALKRQRR